MCRPVFDFINGKGSAEVAHSDSLIFTSVEHRKEESRFVRLCHKTAGPAACAIGLFGILLVSETCPDLVLGTRFPGTVFAGILGGLAGLVFVLRWLLHKLTTLENKKAESGREKDD